MDLIRSTFLNYTVIHSIGGGPSYYCNVIQSGSRRGGLSSPKTRPELGNSRRKMINIIDI